VKTETERMGGSPIWGGVLGAVLLVWSVTIVLAPELGSLVAVFGSPLLAWYVIVRLVGGGPAAISRAAAPRPDVSERRAATLSELRADPHLLARVSVRSGGVCPACGGPGPLRLHAVLPVGRASTALDQRFQALCDTCSAARRAQPTLALW
jgi:hypothetical protein